MTIKGGLGGPQIYLVKSGGAGVTSVLLGTDLLSEIRSKLMINHGFVTQNEIWTSEIFVVELYVPNPS